MEKGKVKVWYDKLTDIFYMLFKEGPSYEVVDADPDVRVCALGGDEVSSNANSECRRQGFCVEEEVAGYMRKKN